MRSPRARKGGANEHGGEWERIYPNRRNTRVARGRYNEDSALVMRKHGTAAAGALVAVVRLNAAVRGFVLGSARGRSRR
ncbi:hypothetical protein EVAR_94687_1 [Eumeta japonica]|uniref:Uncharacterized protein n=1 Tax=Eumeta variegata TaxID=151549 RepID=A0A4C1UWW1_EUMVA|nr:hypothetical protein EVAR_94687_1 [Eumeta japonica]